jgi:signal transduction histidine kinase
MTLQRQSGNRLCLTQFVIGLVFLIFGNAVEFLSINIAYAEQHSQANRTQVSNYAEEINRLARNNPGEAITLANGLLLLDEVKNDSALSISINYEKAYALYLAGQFKKCIELAKQIEKQSHSEGLRELNAWSLALQGHVLQDLGLYDEALKVYRQSLNTLKSIGQINKVPSLINSVANVYFSSQKYDKALRYYSKIKEYTDDPRMIGHMYFGIGITYERLNDFNNAEQSLQKALKIYKNVNDSFSQQLAVSSLAKVNFRMGNLTKAESLYLKALEISKQNGYKIRRPYIYAGLVELYLTNKDLKNAKKYLALSKQEPETYTDSSNELLNLERLYYEHLGDYQKAYKLSLHIVDNKNKAQAMRSATQSEVLGVLFGLDAANAQVELLKKENELQQLKIKSQKQFLITVIAALIAGLLVIGFIFYRREHRKQLQEQQLINAKLKELDKLKDKVLANTSHELRTPLNGIIGLSEAMLEDKELVKDPIVRENLQLIHQSGERLLSLVDDIIDAAQIQERRLNIRPEKFNLCQLVEHTVKLLQPSAEKKRLLLTIHCEPDLPDVFADQKRISQVLTNLIKNAIKFSHDGEIKITLIDVGEHVLCKVSDQGVGIEPQMMERIFHPFERGTDGEAVDAEGVGLGLSIVREILALHGSDIRVNSKPGVGTEFFFELKAVRSEPA